MTTRNDIIDLVDRLIQPPMTFEQALDELEHLSEEIQSRIDALKDDLRQRDESLP